MSLRRSNGRLLSSDSSSTPRVATHLYWSYLRTDCLSSGGSCLWCIHCSVSVLLILHSSNRTVVDWRYFLKQISIYDSFNFKQDWQWFYRNYEEQAWYITELGRTKWSITIAIIRMAYLHIANEQCKQNQSKSCHNYGKNYFPNKSACGKILSQGTASINRR